MAALDDEFLRFQAEIGMLVADPAAGALKFTTHIHASLSRVAVCMNRRCDGSAAGIGQVPPTALLLQSRLPVPQQNPRPSAQPSAQQLAQQLVLQVLPRSRW
jgi:hypothetical protein